MEISNRKLSLGMRRDIRNSPIYREVQEYFRVIHAPGEGFVSDAADASVEPNGRRGAVTGTVFRNLESPPATRICLIELDSGAMIELDSGEHNDRLPRWSPDGRFLAFLSDRREPGVFQLWLLRAGDTGSPIETPRIDGSVEYLHWSPCGRHVLLGVAGLGADLAGYQGAKTIAVRQDSQPEWMPTVDTGNAQNLWRTIHVHDVDTSTTRNISRDGFNYWEANWLSSQRVLGVVSNWHGEGSWYRSRLICHDLVGGGVQTLLVPADQIGTPAASADGTWVSVVEAVASDRSLICGTLKILRVDSGIWHALDTAQVAVTHAIWRDKEQVVYAGHRGLLTVVSELSIAEGATRTHWSGPERTIGEWHPSVCAMPMGGAVAVAESFDVAPELVHMKDGAYRVIRSFASSASRVENFSRASAEPVTWRARDNLEIQGWLIRPAGDGPSPLVLDIHGGPVWQCRNRWAGRLRGAKVLADHGIASLYPNPRGSSGQGDEFARLVVGDMGGEDTFDYLSGCDAMVGRGIADPARLGVTGISYGGFAAAWLITQDNRFAAAVPISPVTNWYSQHRTSQIPFFDELFLAGSASEANGLYFERSPVMFAANVSTPTLLLAGGLDRSTPPTQALEFHRSLLEHDVISTFVLYPKAGHGIRDLPEMLDATTRCVDWFLTHLKS